MFSKILLFGNLGAGKSSLAWQLNLILGWPIVAIDDFRKKYGDSTEISERKCQEIFAHTASYNECQIIECTGLGITGKLLQESLKMFSGNIFLFVIDSDIEKIYQRIKNRNWKDIPLPPTSETIYETILRLDQELRKNNFSFIQEWNVTFSCILKNNSQQDYDNILEYIINILYEKRSIH